MYCPFCGVKNTTGPTQCFVCGKKLPSLDAEAPVKPVPVRASGPVRERPAAPRPAHLGDRLIAVILDSVLLAALLLVAASAVWWHRLIIPPIAVAIGGTFAVIFLYYWLLEGAFGATLGKAIIGVRVGGVAGTTHGFGAAATRNAFRLVDGLPLYIPGFFVAVFSRSRRRLGDYVANAVVLDQPLSVGRRAAVTLLWLAFIGASIWGAVVLRPEWVEAVRSRVSS